MKLAAIDIGSNSIHLVVVRAEPGRRLEIVDREKEMVRLGAVTLREHQLSKETIDRAITTLLRFKKIAEHNGADPIITTATSAVRESSNSEEFIEQVRKGVGLDVQVLPAVEEARLIALAVSEVTEFSGRRALIVDIGGGSTEFIITDGVEPRLLLSIRVGAVRLTEKFITTDPVSQNELDRLVTHIRSDLSRAVWETRNVGFDFVIGTAGTISNMVSAAALADQSNRIEDAPEFEPFSQMVTLDQIERLNRRLVRMSLRERGRVPGIEKQRADIIIAGGMLLESIMLELNAGEMTSCDWSLREGVILDHLRRTSEVQTMRTPRSVAATIEDRLLIPSTDDSALDVRARSVLSVARRYDYDVAHSHHVARLVCRIFDDTVDLHGLNGRHRDLLQYAAILHDIGYHIAHNNHHRHGLYLIKNSEMPGFTGSEIAMMATMIRYHRGSLPRRASDARSRREHEDYYALDRAQRPRLLRLAALLQIADGLDRSHSRLVSDVRCAIDGNTVKFAVESLGECDLEMWSAERKASWFADIFNVSVTFERELTGATQKEAAVV